MSSTSANLPVMNGNFLNNLRVQRAANILVAAEDDDFDDCTLQKLRNEGFRVEYIAMGTSTGRAFTDRLHAAADTMTGVSDQYAIIAYGDAATCVLESHLNGAPRLCALIAYYPSSIPDPRRTRFPMSLSVLVHFAGKSIGLRRRPEILGLQGKAKTVQRRLDAGVGLGGDMQLKYHSFKYEDVEPGFAEYDLEDHDEVAEDLAWGRTLETLRCAFNMRADNGQLRDQLFRDLECDLHKALEVTSAQARITYAPTLSGAVSPDELQRFYSEFFSPGPKQLKAKLISRTVGVDRVVDEMAISFHHDIEVPWLLPGIPPSGKNVSVVLVSIVCIRGGLLAHEHVYWDQASVLVQVGLIDAKYVPEHFRAQGVKRLPVVGVESYEAITTGNSAVGRNALILDWDE